MSFTQLYCTNVSIKTWITLLEHDHLRTSRNSHFQTVSFIISTIASKIFVHPSSKLYPFNMAVLDVQLTRLYTTSGEPHRTLKKPYTSLPISYLEKKKKKEEKHPTPKTSGSPSTLLFLTVLFAAINPPSTHHNLPSTSQPKRPKNHKPIPVETSPYPQTPTTPTPPQPAQIIPGRAPPNIANHLFFFTQY